MNISRYVRGGKVLCKYSINKIFRGLKVSRPPTFIVGCGHSGTSIVLRIIGSHPKIYSVKRKSRMALSGKKKFENQKRKFDIKAVSEGYKRWIEKTPRQIRVIDEILKWSPESKIILIVRDGRDVVCSMRDRYGYIKTGIERWVRDNRQGEKYWKENNLLVVKYESSVSETEKVAQKTAPFIGVNFSREMVNYHEESKKYYADELNKPDDISENHAQYRNWQTNQPIFDGSGRWKKELDVEEKKIIKEIGRDMLVRYEYAEGYGW
jgi:hypothetical protein